MGRELQDDQNPRLRSHSPGALGDQTEEWKEGYRGEEHPERQSIQQLRAEFAVHPGEREDLNDTADESGDTLDDTDGERAHGETAQWDARRIHEWHQYDEAQVDDCEEGVVENGPENARYEDGTKTDRFLGKGICDRTGGNDNVLFGGGWIGTTCFLNHAGLYLAWFSTTATGRFLCNELFWSIAIVSSPQSLRRLSAQAMISAREDTLLLTPQGQV